MPAVAAARALLDPFKTPVIEVERVIAGVVVDVATDPEKPFADTTLTLVTVPVPAAYVGIFNVPPENVAAPLVPVVVRVKGAAYDPAPFRNVLADPPVVNVTPLTLEVVIVAPEKVGLVAKTTFPVPVVPETVVPWILATVAADDPGPLAVTSPVNAVI